MTQFLLFRVLFSCLIFSILLSSCSSPPTAKPVSLSFASGPSARNALLEIENKYRQEKFNVTIKYTFTGATVLKKRIEQKDLFDIFLTTSKSVMDDLDKQGLVRSATRQSLFTNKMVLIVPVDSTLGITDFKDLTSDRVKKIALGTENLGVGQYTKEILTNLGIFSQIQSKAVWFNVEVREIAKALESKQADAGIIFLSEAKLSQKVKIVAIAPENTHTAIMLYVAILTNSRYPQEAKEFINFLTGPKGIPVFEKYGFLAIPSSLKP